MKEKPILFSTPMVKAVLNGTKTQTRRVVKLKDCSNVHKAYAEADWKNEPMKLMEKDGFWYCELCGNGVSPKSEGIKCPYGKVGDQFWVRETFHLTEHGYSLFKADAEGDQIYLGTDDGGPVYAPVSDYKWKPSIFMPRDQSRIQLNDY